MEIRIRQARAADIDTLVALRFAYLSIDFALEDGPVRSSIEAQLHGYFTRRLAGENFTAFLAEAEGQAVGTAFLVLEERPANTEWTNGWVGTILNVYTNPAFRRQGIAEGLVRRLLAAAKQAGATWVELSSSEAGRPLYHKLGFEASDFTQMGISP